MKICIDTNAYSMLMNGKNIELIEMFEKTKTIFIPVIVLGEMYSGFMMGSKHKKNIKELENFLKLPGVEITDINKEIANRYGILVKQLKEAGTPLPVNDIWIAAATLEKGARLVSYDSHFNFIKGLIVLSP